MLSAALIDGALDRSVVLGYGSVGLQLRRRLPGWPADPPRMDGKVVLVTGAAAGLGHAAAIGFARLGATVHVHARTAPRADQAAQAVREAVPGAEVQPHSCDISELTQLREFARGLEASVARLDVLVNNAGVMPRRRTRTQDGHELMFATHVLAPFALTQWLADPLGAAAPGRVINVSSGGMYAQALPAGAGGPESDADAYNANRFYARTKRAEVTITEQWAQRLATRGVVVHAMHPGWADTGGVQDALPAFRAATRLILRDDAAGADTIVWLGAAPEAAHSTGGFWHDRRRRPTHYLVGAGEDDDAARAELWEYCAAAIGR